MNRLALILSNPGEPNKDNYCKGVYKDVQNYTSFLLSPLGGYWKRSEINCMEKPTIQQVRQKITNFGNYDYILVIFTGHGYYDGDRKSTILELNKDEDLNASEFSRGSNKLTLILDCCRVKYSASAELIALSEKKEKVKPKLDPEQCRFYYDLKISKCPNELITMYACKIDQKAGDDDEYGGAYSYALIKEAYLWGDTKDIDTNKEYSILDVNIAHNNAIPMVYRQRGDRQTPHIQKPRSGPYFPFAVIA